GTVSFSGLAVPVPAGGNTVLTVKLDLGAVGTGAGNPSDDVKVSLTSAKATGSNGSNGAVTGTTVAGTDQYVFKSVPTLITDTSGVLGGSSSGVLSTGLQTLYQFKVTAGAQPVSWTGVKFTISTTSGVTSLGTPTLFDASTNQALTNMNCTQTGATIFCGETGSTENQVNTTKSYYLQANVGITGALTGQSVSVNIQH